MRGRLGAFCLRARGQTRVCRDGGGAGGAEAVDADSQRPHLQTGPSVEHSHAGGVLGAFSVASAIRAWTVPSVQTRRRLRVRGRARSSPLRPVEQRTEGLP